MCIPLGFYNSPLPYYNATEIKQAIACNENAMQGFDPSGIVNDYTPIFPNGEQIPVYSTINALNNYIITTAQANGVDLSTQNASTTTTIPPTTTIQPTTTIPPQVPPQSPSLIDQIISFITGIQAAIQNFLVGLGI